MNTILWVLLTSILWPALLLYASQRGRRARRRILIIQWAKLGDMVCTTPMFRAIKQSHPDWEVHVLCRASSAPVLRGNPFVDRVIVHTGTRRELIQQVSRNGYDAVINCLPGAFWSLVGLWCGAKDRINTYSLRHGHLVRWTRILNTVNLRFDTCTPSVTHYLKLLELLGVAPIPYTLDFFPSEDEQKKAADWMRRHHLQPRNFVCFNVSAGNTIKEWPVEHFAELADFVTARHQIPVVLSTLDRARVEQIRALTKHKDRIVDGSSLSLGQAAAVYAESAAFVGVDTGPMFIAHAVGAPVVVIVGGSDPSQQIPPEGDHVIHVLPPPGCEPWMFVTQSPKTATPEQLRCVHGTDVGSVSVAVERLLQHRRDK